MNHIPIHFFLLGLFFDAFFLQINPDLESISKIKEKSKIPGISYTWLEERTIKESFALGIANSTNQPLDQETVFSAASLSKPVFAHIVFQLVEEGILELDTPIYTYFDYPDVSEDPRYKLVTAKMVLSHTTGLPNWRKGNLHFHHNPGERFQYSGEGFVWLQKAIEFLTEKGLEELAKEYVFHPFGMKRSSFVYLEEFDDNHSLSFRKNGKEMPKGKIKNPNAAASLQTTSYDFGLFLEALLEGKRMSLNSQQMMFSPQIPVDPKVGKDQQIFWGLGVGLQITPEGKQIFQWGDKFTFRGYFTANVDKGKAVVYFTNSEHGLRSVREFVGLAMPDPQPACDWMGYD